MKNSFLVFYATVQIDKIAAGLELGKWEINNDNTTNATAFFENMNWNCAAAATAEVVNEAQF